MLESSDGELRSDGERPGRRPAEGREGVGRLTRAGVAHEEKSEMCEAPSHRGTLVFAGVGLAALILALAACQGRPVPLAAQAGSTVVIPLQGLTSTTVVGYGGETLEDFQRGTLVFRLDGPSGMELLTRGTSAVAAAPTTAAARGELLATPLEVVALVDIPAGAPEGPHTLYVTRRRIENGAPVEYAFPGYSGTLTILPEHVVAGGQTETGARTPFEAYSCGPLGCGFGDVSTSLPGVIPEPELRVRLNLAVSAVELTLSYPSDVIEVRDVLEPPVGLRVNELASVWHVELDPENPGTLSVKAVAGALPFTTLSLVFGLLDGGAAILDPNDIGVSVQKAFNASGSPLTVSVASKTIR